MASATTVTETNVYLDGGVNPVRLDVTPLAGRYWVRVINPHATLRIFIGHAYATTNTANCETVDPFNGVWEDSLGPNVGIWAVGEAGYPTNVYVRIKQYA